MTLWRDRQRLRLRVPITPQVAATLALPFSGVPARTSRDAPSIKRQITASSIFPLRPGLAHDASPPSRP
jgi:hypothetical protein